MDKLIKCFELTGYQVVSVIGSGGKSSLIKYLSNALRYERILVSTTTRILYPNKEEYDYIYHHSYQNLGRDGVGVTIAGDIVEEDIKKLKMPEDENFRRAFSKFDKIFLEADGSRGLPLKAWADYEPVVLPETTMTIGVIPINSLGLKVNFSNIHRFPLWLELTEENPDAIISLEALTKTITHEKGMWKNAKGKRILCINQVGNGSQLNVAKDIVLSLPTTLKMSMSKIIACSAKDEQGYVLWDNTKG